MQWFYAKDGQQIGPVEFTEIERLHAAGQITGDTLVWQQGTASWVKLHSLLAGATPSVPPISGAIAPPISSISAPYSSGQKTNTLAILALIFGILGVCCFIFPIAAIVCGHIGQGQIRNSNGAETGNGLALAGLILGYLMIALTIFGVIFNIYTGAFNNFPR